MKNGYLVATAHTTGINLPTNSYACTNLRILIR